jgi:polyisoprenoid-binding protein YceI
MKAPIALLLALAAASAAHAELAIYALDPEHSFVTFEVLHFGTSTLRGRFGPLSGSVEIDRAAGTGSVSLRIDTGSVDTGLPAFDARLRQPDLLAAEAFPVAYFVATNFQFDGGILRAVKGEFTLRDVSQGLELRALRFGCHTHPLLQREVCGGDFEGELKRGDFGASFGMPFVANRVRLVVQAEGIRQ